MWIHIGFNLFPGRQTNADPDPQLWLQVHDLRDLYLRYCSFHPVNLDQKAWYNNFLNNIFRNFVSIHGAEICLLCSTKKVSKCYFRHLFSNETSGCFSYCAHCTVRYGRVMWVQQGARWYIKQAKLNVLRYLRLH